MNYVFRGSTLYAAVGRAACEGLDLGLADEIEVTVDGLLETVYDWTANNLLTNISSAP